MPGCQRCHVRLNDMKSPVMHDAVPASTSPYSSMAEWQWRFQHERRVSDSPLSRSKRRCQDWEQSAAWYVTCRTPFSNEPSFVVRHVGVSNAPLLDPVVRRSSFSFGFRRSCPVQEVPRGGHRVLCVPAVQQCQRCHVNTASICESEGIANPAAMSTVVLTWLVDHLAMDLAIDLESLSGCGAHLQAVLRRPPRSSR